MREVAFEQTPHARLELAVSGLAVALPQAHENAQDARVALRRERPIGGAERRALSRRSDIAIEHCRLDRRAHVAARILEHRGEVIGGMADQRVLKIEQTEMFNAAASIDEHDIFGMKVAQHGDTRQAVLLDGRQRRSPRRAKSVAIDSKVQRGAVPVGEQHHLVEPLFDAVDGQPRHRGARVQMDEQVGDPGVEFGLRRRARVERFAQPHIAEILDQQQALRQIAGEDRGRGHPLFAQPFGDRDEGARVFVRRRRIHQHRLPPLTDNAEIAAERGIARERQNAGIAPAMRGKKGVRVFMLSPAGKMSAFQRAQMYSLQDPNIFNIAIEGLFDDCQDIVKAVSEDLEYKARQKIGTVNSINWGRISAQVVYYFNAYLRTAEKIGDPVSFAVPSGNFGNVLAGHIARQMGLPIRKLIVATNENNVLDEFFKTGVYRPRKSAETYITSSPSMDISKASNFERFVYDLLGRDPKALKALWQDLAANGQFDLSEDPRFKRVEEDFGFQSGSSNHQNRLDTIKEVFARTGTLIDTHTADAVKVARDLVEPGVPMVILETALAVKFAETIEEATGQTPPVPAQFQGIEKLPQRVVEMPISVEQVKTFIAENTGL